MPHTRWPVARAVGVFAISGLVALGVVALVTDAASRHTGTDAAVRDVRRDTDLLARTSIQPKLSDGIVSGDPAAIAAMDSEVHQHVLDKDLVRVKLWRSDGTIVYSDKTALIGSRYVLAADDREAFDSGRAAAGVSDLSRPENRFERPFGKLIEVYAPVRTPSGYVLLFETYFRYDAVTAAGRRAWHDFAPITLLALVGLEALQLPLAWRLGRRVRSSQAHQAVLLQRAIDASDAERRRIASDLHDGVVQDLASVSYSLASVEAKVDPPARMAIHDAALGTRRSIRSLRSLLVELYPPSLRDAGLHAALSDLTAPLASQGIDARLEMEDDGDFGDDVESLLYRAAQEAVRNTVKHADAKHVEIRLSRNDHRAVLEVVDDGVGFDAQAAAGKPAEGHVGLRVLTDLVAGAGGDLTVSSEPGGGTRVHVEVPA